jgi:hypothetical protein
MPQVLNHRASNRLDAFFVPDVTVGRWTHEKHRVVMQFRNLPLLYLRGIKNRSAGPCIAYREAQHVGARYKLVQPSRHLRIVVMW